MFIWLSDVLYRARRRVLFLALVLILGTGIFGLNVFHSLKNDGYSNPASESAQAAQLLNTKLGGSLLDMIILMRSPTLHVTDPVFTQAATQLLTRLKTRSEVASLTSYYSTQSAYFISRDGHETFVLLQLTGQDVAIKEQEYQAIRPLLTSPTLQIAVGGTIPVNAAVSQQIRTDLAHAELITFPVLAVLLLLVFGSLLAAGLPLLIGGISILGAFAVLHLLTMVTDVSVYALNVVTMLGLGLAIDYALLIVTRFREELAKDESDIAGALQRTLMTAGRTVLFSALTIGASLLSLLLFPVPFLRSIGLGAMAAVLVVMLTSLTVLPALLAVLGQRVNAFSLNRLFTWRVHNTARDQQRGAWYRLSELVMRWPLPVALTVLVLLLTLGWPSLHITFATPDEKVLPAGQMERVVSARLRQDFAQEGNAQITIVVTTPGNAFAPKNLANLASYTNSIVALPGVERVMSIVNLDPRLTLSQYQQLYAQPSYDPTLMRVASPLVNGNVTKMTVYLHPADHTQAAIALVERIRALVAPGGLVPLVDGLTPEQIDLLASLWSTFPLAVCAIFLSILVLLFWMTGSLVIPLKATLLNMLSLTATFGGLVWIFQDGHLQGWLHFQSVGSIDATQPILIFAIAFGLSMDYEVFLLSRIKECFDQTGDNRLAVASGLQSTGWLITSEALLLAIVLGAFGTAKIIFIQEIGIGLASAIIMDATLIRMLLVPAMMCLLGNFNWWAPPLPRWLHPRLASAATPPVQSTGHNEPPPLGTTGTTLPVPQSAGEATHDQPDMPVPAPMGEQRSIETTSVPTQLGDFTMPYAVTVWEQDRLVSAPTQPMEKLSVPRALTLRIKAR